MKFKHKEVKKKMLTSFLTVSLLLSTSMGLKANELKQEEEKKEIKLNVVVLEDEFKVHLPNPSKIEVKELPFEKKEGIARYYAHKGVYIVKEDEILFNGFNFSFVNFKQPFNNESELLSTDFLHIKKDHFNDYMAIFTFFKDCTFRYYVFQPGSTNVLINTVRVPKFDVPDDAKIQITGLNLKTGKYGIRITSSKFEEPREYTAIIVLEERKKDEKKD
jgi:hypothetical protein